MNPNDQKPVVLPITIPSTVELEGHGKLQVTEQNHVWTGGEGSVFRVRDDLVVKIYREEAKKQRNALSEKVPLLKVIRSQEIIAPGGIVTNPKGGRPLGFWANFVDGIPLPPFFTKDRDAVGFGNEDVNTLVEKMRTAVVLRAHQGGAIIGDPNELNWLLQWESQSRRLMVFAIDVDSWGIGRWTVSAVSPGVQDYHSNGFTSATDWFSVGIVTFQLYTGIHPYKGTLDGYARKDLVKRMQDNKSVFTSGVRLNAAVRDPYKTIPPVLLDWYIATFQNGERTEMPSPFATGVAITVAGRVLRVVTSGQGSLVFEKIYESSSARATRVFPCGIALLSDGYLADLFTKQYIGGKHSLSCEVVSVEEGWLVGEMKGKDVSFCFISRQQPQKEIPVFLQVAGQRIVRYENRLFVVMSQKLAEVSFFLVAKGSIVSIGDSWDVLVNSTCWFDGVGIMDAIGAMFVVAPFGAKSCGVVRVRELDGLRPVAARSGNGFISIIATDKNGDYRKIELTMKPDYGGYEYWSSVTDAQNLNIALVPKGTGCVQVAIVEDGRMDVYVPANKQQRAVTDRMVTTDMILGVWNDKVLYIKDGVVWHVRMK